MISHVLDTCALLDLVAGRWTEKNARRELAKAAAPAVLSVSVWEFARKLRLGKVKPPCDLRGLTRFVREVCARHQIRLEPLDDATCEEAELLPPHHEDPFDRMIIALAVRSACPVFSTDRKFLLYPVRVIPQR